MSTAVIGRDVRQGNRVLRNAQEIAKSAAVIGRALISRYDRLHVSKLLSAVIVASVAVIAGALGAIRPGTLAYFLGALWAGGYILLCFSRPFIAFAILLLFALTVWLSGIKMAGGISAMIGLGAIYTLFWLSRLLVRSEIFTKVKEYRLLLALLVVTGITTAFHLGGPAGLGAVSTYLQLFLLFSLVINLTTTPERLTAIGNLVIVSSALLAVLILLDQIGWLPPQLIPEQNLSMAPGVAVIISRTGGVWGDANVTALQLTIALPFIMARWPGASYVRRALLLAAGGAILGAFVWTFSMGGLLGLAVMLLIKMLTSPRRHRLLIIARNGLIGIVALSTFLVFAPEPFVERVKVVFGSNLAALNAFDRASLLTIGTTRGDAWWAALQAIAAAPLLGYGPGNAMYAIASYSILRSLNYLSPHNMFLAVAGDLGLAGLAVFVALFVSALQSVRSRPDAPAVTSGLHRTRQAIVIALIGFAVQGMALEVHNMKLLWILLGMAVACRELSARSPVCQTEAER
jgi:O-antigen ligase